VFKNNISTFEIKAIMNLKLFLFVVIIFIQHYQPHYNYSSKH